MGPGTTIREAIASIEDHLRTIKSELDDLERDLNDAEDRAWEAETDLDNCRDELNVGCN